MLNKLARSLSFRLLAVFVLLGGLFVFGTYKAIQRVYNSDEIRGLISGHLSLHVSYVRQDIGLPPRIERAESITDRVPVDIRIFGPDIDWASDNDFPRIETLSFAPSPKFSDDPGAWVDELQDVEFAEFEKHTFLKMKQGPYDIVVSTPRIADTEEGPDLINSIIAMGLSFLLIAYMAVRWLFRPIGSIRTGAAHIGSGNFNYRIRQIRQDELGDLATDINELAGDVERMLDAKRALLLGISHELRTPLSRMRLILEFLDNEDDQDSLRSEIDEMEKIVTALLEAERLNSRHVPLVRTSVSVAGLVNELIDDFFSRYRDRLQVELPKQAIQVSIDEPRITLLLKNLLSNALRYSSADDGPVRLAARDDNGVLVLTVADNGPGLPQDQIDHIGEPFYRSDPSRARTSGGTGLGLYLASLVAKAHGGTLQLVNTDSPGATFEARIPYPDERND